MLGKDLSKDDNNGTNEKTDSRGIKLLHYKTKFINLKGKHLLSICNIYDKS